MADREPGEQLLACCYSGREVGLGKGEVLQPPDVLELEPEWLVWCVDAITATIVAMSASVAQSFDGETSGSTYVAARSTAM